MGAPTPGREADRPVAFLTTLPTLEDKLYREDQLGIRKGILPCNNIILNNIKILRNRPHSIPVVDKFLNVPHQHFEQY